MTVVGTEVTSHLTHSSENKNSKTNRLQKKKKKMSTQID